MLLVFFLEDEPFMVLQFDSRHIKKAPLHELFAETLVAGGLLVNDSRVPY
jgi:hypothetical protein